MVRGGRPGRERTHLLGSDAHGLRGPRPRQGRVWPKRSGVAMNWASRGTHTTERIRSIMDIWVSLEAGQIEEATTLVARLRQLSEQSGLDLWQWVGRRQHATVKALAALAAGADAATLTDRAEKLVRHVDGSRLMHLNSYLTFHDAVIGRLLIAAGQPEKARERLEMALRHAEETWHALLRRGADARCARTRSPTRKNAALPWPTRSRTRATRARPCSNCAACWILSNCSVRRICPSWPTLSAASPATRRWPEFARAQRILVTHRGQR